MTKQMIIAARDTQQWCVSFFFSTHFLFFLNRLSNEPSFHSGKTRQRRTDRFCNKLVLSGKSKTSALEFKTIAIHVLLVCLARKDLKAVPTAHLFFKTKTPKCNVIQLILWGMNGCIKELCLKLIYDDV